MGFRAECDVDPLTFRGAHDIQEVTDQWQLDVANEIRHEDQCIRNNPDYRNLTPRKVSGNLLA
jgi:hypothetical protein